MDAISEDHAHEWLYSGQNHITSDFWLLWQSINNKLSTYIMAILEHITDMPRLSREADYTDRMTKYLKPLLTLFTVHSASAAS